MLKIVVNEFGPPETLEVVQADAPDIRFEPIKRFSDPHTGWHSDT